MAASAEQLVAKLQRADQRVDFFAGVVKPEARPAGRRHTHVCHQRLGAVVARPHRDPALVHDGGDVTFNPIWR